MKVEIEGGTVLEFPDDTPPQVVQDTVKRLIQQQSGQIGEAVPATQTPTPALTEPPRPEDHGLFRALDPLSKIKVVGADWVNQRLIEGGKIGSESTPSNIGRRLATPLPLQAIGQFDLPVAPRHAQDVVELAALGRAARGVQGFVGGVRQGLKTGPGTTLEAKPPVGTAQTPIVEPGASQAPKMAPLVGEGDANLVREVREGRLHPGSAEYITDMVREEAMSGRFVWNPAKPAMENIADVIARRIPGPEGAELAAYYRQVTSEQGKVFQKYAQLTKEMAALKTEFAPLPDSGLQPIWRRTTNFIKGMYVAQLAVAIRNAVVGAGRVGLDVIQAPLDTSIQQIFKLPARSRDADGLVEAWEVLRQLSPKARAEVREIMQHYPIDDKRVFGSYSSDVLTRLGLGAEKGIPEKVADTVNWANRFQEFTFRGGAVQARLDQRLRFKGRSLQQLMAEGRTGSIAVDDIRYVGEQALELTFAKPPAWGGGAHKFVDFVESTPAQVALWFPRFMVNSSKFLFEYNPTGVLRYLSPRERALLASGETKGVSRALIGSMMLGAAIQFRNSDMAGSRWYLGKLPVDVPGVGKAGEEVDLRPFNPLAAYLFVADVMKRKKEGTLRNLDGKDIVAGVLSVNLKAGTSGYMLDAVMRNFGGDPQEVSENFQQWAGESISGLLNPLGQFVDIYDDFTKNEQIQRDIQDQPFLGPLKKKIPGLQADMPEYVSPTHRGPTIIKEPAARQTTGFRKVPAKNEAEVEYERLGFEAGEIYQSNPDSRIDRIRRHFSAGLFEDVMVPFVTKDVNYNTLPARAAAEQAAQAAKKHGLNPKQQQELQTRLTNELKAYAFSQKLATVHKGVGVLTDLVLAPDDQVVRAIQKLPQDLRRYLREFNITPGTLRKSGLQ